MATIPLRDFIAKGILWGDHGGRLSPSELTEAMCAAYESDSVTSAICSPRQNGKSSAAAQVIAYELLTVPNSYAVLLSGSGDQAGAICAQKLRGPLEQNPLTAELSLQKSATRIHYPEINSTIEVITPQERTAPGRRLSLLMVDEPRGVPRETYEVMRPSIATGGRVIVCGTPGKAEGWWYDLCHPEPGSKDFVKKLNRPVNPRIRMDFIESEKKRLSKTRWGALMAQREWSGAWVHLSENPLIEPADVEACLVDSIEPWNPELDITAMGCDLSFRKDLTSIVVIALRSGRLRILEIEVYDPRGQELSLEFVEGKIESLAKRYRVQRVRLDQYQGVLMAQRLRTKQVIAEPVPITAKTNRELFEVLAETVSERRIEWISHDRLEQELMNLEVSETMSGWRVVDSDKRLHRDVAVSLALAIQPLAPFLSRMPGGYAENLPPPESDVSKDPWRHWDDTSLEDERDKIADEWGEESVRKRRLSVSQQAGRLLGVRGGASGFGRILR